MFYISRSKFDSPFDDESYTFLYFITTSMNSCKCQFRFKMNVLLYLMMFSR